MFLLQEPLNARQTNAVNCLSAILAVANKREIPPIEFGRFLGFEVGANIQHEAEYRRFERDKLRINNVGVILTTNEFSRYQTYGIDGIRFPVPSQTAFYRCWYILFMSCFFDTPVSLQKYHNTLGKMNMWASKPNYWRDLSTIMMVSWELDPTPDEMVDLDITDEGFRVILPEHIRRFVRHNYLPSFGGNHAA